MAVRQKSNLERNMVLPPHPWASSGTRFGTRLLGPNGTRTSFKPPYPVRGRLLVPFPSPNGTRFMPPMWCKVLRPLPVQRGPAILQHSDTPQNAQPSAMRRGTRLVQGPLVQGPTSTVPRTPERSAHRPFPRGLAHWSRPLGRGRQLASFQWQLGTRYLLGPAANFGTRFPRQRGVSGQGYSVLLQYKV